MFVTTKHVVYNDDAFDDILPSEILSLGFICQQRDDWPGGEMNSVTRQSVSFEQYLAQTCGRDATDPRDKVFALIGLVLECRKPSPSTTQ